MAPLAIFDSNKLRLSKCVSKSIIFYIHAKCFDIFIYHYAIFVHNLNL